MLGHNNGQVGCLVGTRSFFPTNNGELQFLTATTCIPDNLIPPHHFHIRTKQKKQYPMMMLMMFMLRVSRKSTDRPPLVQAKENCGQKQIAQLFAGIKEYHLPSSQSVQSTSIFHYNQIEITSLPAKKTMRKENNKHFFLSNWNVKQANCDLQTSAGNWYREFN